MRERNASKIVKSEGAKYWEAMTAPPTDYNLNNYDLKDFLSLKPPYMKARGYWAGHDGDHVRVPVKE